MAAGKKQLIYSFLIFFVPVCVISGIILFYIYTNESTTKIERIRSDELSKILIQEQLLKKYFREIIGDLKFLSKLHETKKYSDDIDYNLSDLVNDFYHLSLHKGLYDQIRYIDYTGMEIVRVNYNEGNPLVVKKEDLQNKKKRYYFQDTIKLKEDEVFISLLDLNIEHGKIETPLKPMLRFGTPVLNRHGDKRGICLLNYSAKILMDDLEKIGNRGLGDFSFLNFEGYWLTTGEEENGWGFMFKDRKEMTFGNKHPHEWEKILSSGSEQIQSQKGLFTFTTFYPLEEEQKSSSGADEAFDSSKSILQGKGYFFKLVSHVPKDVLIKNSEKIFNSLFQLFLFLNFFFLLCSMVMAQFLKNRKRYKRMQENERIQKEKFHGVLEMAGAVCHEINQPLMVISGYSDLLIEDLPEEEKHHKKVLEIKAQTDRLGRITKKLMNITRYQTRSYLNSKIIDIDKASDEK